MSENTKSPFDKEPAEGSRETVDRQLDRQERKSRHVDHQPGDKVSGRPRDGAVDCEHEEEKK
jgi:hypothetical protein